MERDRQGERGERTGRKGQGRAEDRRGGLMIERSWGRVEDGEVQEVWGEVIWNLTLQVLKEIGNWEMGYVLRPPGTSKGFNRE